MNYLPEQLSVEEVNDIISAIFDEIKPEGQKDMGKVMGVASKQLSGKAEGRAISAKVKELLNN